MSEFDFTYRLPNDFKKKVIQYLCSWNKDIVAKAFYKCEYNYEVLNYAFYHGVKGHWHKKMIDFTIEGTKKDIEILQTSDSKIEEAMARALKAEETGFLINDILYLNSNVFINDIGSFLSNEERLNADIECANKVLKDLIDISELLCNNYKYNSDSSENEINDYYRDSLKHKGYNETKDQTRHGISLTGIDAGEVDILITTDGKEIALFEGLKLDYVNSKYIDEHIKKAVINYNYLGTATFIVAYIANDNFESFWERYYKHIENYSFPLPIKKDLEALPYPNATTRVAMTILSRDGFDFPVYFMAINLN